MRKGVPVDDVKTTILAQGDRLVLSANPSKIAKAQSIVRFVQDVLNAKYGLQDGDDINLDGSIVRAEDTARKINILIAVFIHTLQQFLNNRPA